MDDSSNAKFVSIATAMVSSCLMALVPGCSGQDHSPDPHRKAPGYERTREQAEQVIAVIPLDDDVDARPISDQEILTLVVPMTKEDLSSVIELLTEQNRIVKRDRGYLQRVELNG